MSDRQSRAAPSSPLDHRPLAAAAIVGCVLAGGRSSRMGGGDKGLRPLAGRALMERAVDRLAGRLPCVIVNANGDPDRFSRFGLTVVGDDPPDGSGPLAGVLAALEWAARCRPEARAVLTVAADTPFFPDDLIERLATAPGAGRRPVVAASDVGVHPTFGLWPVDFSGPLRRLLVEQGRRRMMLAVEAADGETVSFGPLVVGGRLIDPFFNVNTPEDLAEAEAIAADLDGAAAIVETGGNTSLDPGGGTR